MTNPYVKQRLEALISIFRAVCKGGDKSSSALKGSEREFFTSQFLSSVIAPPFRIGNGDITDAAGNEWKSDAADNKSGQCDIVIEHGNSISLSIVKDGPRLYFAEGVCAVIEVKSDLVGESTGTWKEIKDSFSKLKPLQRNLLASISYGKPSKQIPYFVVGYRGWENLTTLKSKREKLGVDGILILESALYCGKTIKGKIVEGAKEESLLLFLMALQQLTGQMMGAVPNYQAYRR